jgi:hypothetical protein
VVKLSLDVPQGLLYAGNRGAENRAAPVKAAAVQYLPNILDAHGVPADHVIPQLFYAGSYRIRPAFHHGLPPAGNSVVGGDFQEKSARRNLEQFHFFDFHGGSFLWRIARAFLSR